MTNTNDRPATAMTGIDIRKTLLKYGLRPSDYDEQAIWDEEPETEQEVMNAASRQWLRGHSHD